MADRLIEYQLGLFGHPVKHSQSPQIHAEFANQFGLNVHYDLIDVPADAFASKFQNWMKTAYGCNITVPHKNAAADSVDKLTERAKNAGAVNTVYWRDEQLVGDNTDGDGLILDLRNKKVKLKDTHVLILGAGGAVQGIIPSLLNQGVESIEILNRNREKANKLVTQVGSDRCAVAGLKMHIPYDLIIHATSMGHHGLSPELPDHIFHENTIAYDLSYGSAAQPFLNATKLKGAAKTYDGLGMLYGQAALAFELWFGKKPMINMSTGT